MRDSIGDARALAAALAVTGLSCAVESRDRLAVVTAGAADLARLAVEHTRREVLAEATRHGFTHLAVELADDRGAADAPAARAALLRD